MNERGEEGGIALFQSSPQVGTKRPSVAKERAQGTESTINLKQARLIWIRNRRINNDERLNE
jgi:hypothetical protein